jgi:hypothetical protein
MAMTPSTPFYFSTPFIIICLLFCPLVGLLLMWVGRVWSTGIRAAVTLVYAAMMVLSFFMFFYTVHKSTEATGKQMQMFIEEMQNLQPPPEVYPPEYYEELERRGSSPYDYYEEEPPQISPTKKAVQIELGHWTWSNQASPPAVRIEGNVMNKTGSAFEGLKAYVTAEDANGMLLGVGSAPLSPTTLPAGGTSSFVVVINDAQCTTDNLNISCRFEY